MKGGFGRAGFGAAQDSARGRAAKAAGRSFEEEIEATNEAYARHGLAVMARAHPPVGGPPHALFYKGKGNVDFVGHVRGVPVAFDTKTEAGAASYKHSERDMHEIDFLLRWRSSGGLAFLLLLDRECDTVYCVTQLEALKEGASVPLRTHARSKALPVPMVPVMVRTDTARALDTALGRPVWPWIDVASQISERLRDVLKASA